MYAPPLSYRTHLLGRQDKLAANQRREEKKRIEQKWAASSSGTNTVTFKSGEILLPPVVTGGLASLQTVTAPTSEGDSVLPTSDAPPAKRRRASKWDNDG